MKPSNQLLNIYPNLVPYFRPVPVFGHCLWMFETPEELYPYEIRIKEIDYASTVEMKVKGKLGLYTDNHSWERYKGGQVESGSAHHEYSDFDKIKFEEWVESILKKLLNENIRWGLEDTFKQCINLSAIYKQISDIQILLEYGRKMGLTTSWWFRELWIVESVYYFDRECSISEEAIENISQFIHDSFSYKWTWFCQTIVPLLPQNPPERISEALATKLN